jgi:hypothetical protein
MLLAWRDDHERKAPASWQNTLVDIRCESESDIEQSCDQHNSYADENDCPAFHERPFTPQVFGTILSGKLWAVLSC